MGCPFLLRFFANSSFYTIFTMQIGTETHCKNFLINFELFIPGGDFEIFWEVSDVIEKYSCYTTECDVKHFERHDFLSVCNKF